MAGIKSTSPVINAVQVNHATLGNNAVLIMLLNSGSLRYILNALYFGNIRVDYNGYLLLHSDKTISVTDEELGTLIVNMINKSS